jgi:hypothetical protein
MVDMVHSWSLTLPGEAFKRQGFHPARFSGLPEAHESIRLLPMNFKAIPVTRGKILLPAIAGVALIGGLAFFWLLRAPDVQKDRKIVAQPAYRMQIEGLRFYGTNQGRRVVSITADRFTLRRGKIGFFSTGLTRTALIENAIIDIYAGAPSPPGVGPEYRSAETPPVGASLLHEPVKASPAGEFDFGGLFAEETFSSLFPVRNIAEIAVSPVTVHLHDDRTVLTRIIAAKASVRLREKEILFTGQVRVSSGGAELTTEQLALLPGTSRLRTDHPFVLKRGNRTLAGTGLTADLFLEPR